MAKSNKNAQNAEQKTSKKAHGEQKRKTPKKSSSNKQLLENNTKKDILGCVLIFIGIALFVIAIVPTDAPVTGAIITCLRYVIGIGVYFLPFFIIALGISFFFHMDRQFVTIRMAIGFALIVPAVLSIISTCAPCVNTKHYEMLFNSDVLTAHGGIVGSVFSWIGCTLLGNIVTIIIMAGIIVAGLIVIGLSVSKIIARVIERRENIDRSRNSYIEQQVPIQQQYEQSNETWEQDEQGQTQLLNQEPMPKRSLFSKFKKQQPSIRRSPEPQNIEDELSFEPNQTETKVIPDNVADKPTENTPEPEDKSSKKTQVITPAAKPTQKLDNAKAKKKKSAGGKTSAYPTPSENFVLPSMDMLEHKSGNEDATQSQTTLKNTANKLQDTLSNFGITAKVVGWVEGPTVTLFKVDLPAGIRVSRITALNDDIALALAAPGVRIFAPIPGTTYVGIEIPNSVRQNVLLSEVLEKAKSGPLQVAIGKDVEGNCIASDLAKMPHLLIGGTTGSGKSVSINAMIMSILMRATPDEVKLILVDPKRVEFTPYNDIPHLYVPVVTEAKEAASALNWGCAEMERRLKVFSANGVRNIGGYNAKCQQGATDNDGNPLEEFPYIVIIIDELADLMMAVGKEVEYSIARLAQLARAAGIHLIVATQRPSTNIVTGLIKANITNRIAFNVASGIDSRVILDTGGAESLIGLGDLLLSKPELSKPLRIQGCYVSEAEIERVVNHLKEQGSPEYHEDILQTQFSGNVVDSNGSSGPFTGAAGDDSLVWEAAEMIVQNGYGSTSSLQRRFKIGYSRAGRIMDMLEEKGIVGPQNGSKPRDVLVDATELEGIKALEASENDI